MKKFNKVRDTEIWQILITRIIDYTSSTTKYFLIVDGICNGYMTTMRPILKQIRARVQFGN